MQKPIGPLSSGRPARDRKAISRGCDAEVKTGIGAVWSLRVHRCQKYHRGGLLPLVRPSRRINPSKGVLYLGFIYSDVQVCSQTQLAATALPRKIMNALPSRLPRYQAAKTALHINDEELLTPKEVFSCENVDLFVCPSGAFLRVQANSPAHPSRELDQPPRRALRTAQELAGAGLRNAALSRA